MSDDLTFTVPGMTCGHCEAAVKQEVGAVDGVSAVDGRPADEARHRSRRRPRS